MERKLKNITIAITNLGTGRFEYYDVKDKADYINSISAFNEEFNKYDNDIEAAVRYAVGNTVVAENLQIARQLAFENRIGEKIVTLDGEEIAKKALAAGIEEVVFDRGGYLYTGRVLSLADGAREAGLKF